MPSKPKLEKPIGNYGDRKTYASDYVKGDIEAAVFLGNPHIDHLFTAMQSLGAETWTNRRRMYVIEAMLEKNIPVTQEGIQKYMPTEEEEKRWKADRDQFVKTMYAPFLRAGNINYASPAAQNFDPHLGVAGKPDSKS
jgi:hypothetical protein